MKSKEFIRKLKKAGAVELKGRGKGGHALLQANDKKATVPLHGDADLGPNFIKKICKQLGFDPDEVL